MTTPSPPAGNTPPDPQILLEAPEPVLALNGPPAANAQAATAAAAAAGPGGPADKAAIAALLDEPAVRVWYRRRWIQASALGVLLLIAGIWYWQARKAANATPSYSTQAVARGNLTLTVTANGTIQPTRAINIGSELSGTVLKVNVDVNDNVKKGQVMVVLDTAKLQDQVQRSLAALTAAGALVAQSVATTAESQASLARLEEVAGPRWPAPGGRKPAPVPASSRQRPRCRPTRPTCPRPPSARRPMAWC
jgi:HlyD family secretion protein